MLAAMEGAIRASEMPMASQTLRLRCSFGGPYPAGSLAGPLSLLAASLVAAIAQHLPRMAALRPGSLGLAVRPTHRLVC